ATPATYDYPQLLARSDPSDPDHADEIVTLECVSNEVGGNLISNARWQGVRLAALLQSAGLDPAADIWIVFTCADGYPAAIPRDLFGRSEHGWRFDLERGDPESSPVEPDLGPLDLRLDAETERVVSDRRPRSRRDGRVGRFESRPAVPEWLLRLRLDHIARRM